MHIRVPMLRARVFAPVVLGLSPLVFASCAAFAAQLEGDPIGNWEVRAARAPAASQACIAVCKRRDEACFQHLQDPGMNGNAQEMEQCYEATYQCYARCPGATQRVSQFQQVRLSEALVGACRAGLPPGQRTYCMTRNGVIGQAFDPE